MDSNGGWMDGLIRLPERETRLDLVEKGTFASACQRGASFFMGVEVWVGWSTALARLLRTAQHSTVYSLTARSSVSLLGLGR